MDRTSVEYLRRLSRLVLLEKKRREEEAINQIQEGINLRLDEIRQRREFITKINEVVGEKDTDCASLRRQAHDEEAYRKET